MAFIKTARRNTASEQQRTNQNNVVILLPFPKQRGSNEGASAATAATIAKNKAKEVVTWTRQLETMEVLYYYNIFLAISLVLFLIHLLFPRRRRRDSIRRKESDQLNLSLPMRNQSEEEESTAHRFSSTEDRQERVLGTATTFSTSAPERRRQQQSFSILDSSHNMPLTMQQSRILAALRDTLAAQHPSGSSHRVPSLRIRLETMQRLQNNGIRIYAHGVQSKPKRVWLRYDNSRLIWQTEAPRMVQGRIVMVRGRTHEMPISDILYLDVGKKTTALQKLPNSISGHFCFSILTETGSLDLQANSKLERDAIVSCWIVLLDVLSDRNWRNLYEGSSTIVMG